jgi:predicted oxidoreductase
MAVHAARNYRGDRLMRTAKPHRFLDPENGPLIAVKLNIITRKTLGGLETDLNGQVFNGRGESRPVRRRRGQRFRRRRLSRLQCA